MTNNRTDIYAGWLSTHPGYKALYGPDGLPTAIVKDTAQPSDPNAPINIPQGYQFTAPNYGTTQSQQQLRNPSMQAGEAVNSGQAGVEYATKQIAPGVSYWWVKVKNANRGFRQQAHISEAHAARSRSQLDARTYGVEHLPPVTNVYTSFQPTETSYRYVMSCTAFGYLVFALYNSVGPNYTPLFRENADGTLTQLNYSKGTTHRIKGLAMLQINGTPYLAVCKENQPIELLSDVADTPTSAGSMNADTSGAWGAVMTTLPDSSHLIFTGNTILAGTATQAIGAAHTVEGYVPVGGGGWVMGVQSINSGDVRVWFNALAPEAAGSQLIPGLLATNTYQGAVYSCSQRGDDVQQWKLPVRYVNQSMLIRDGIVYNDGYTAGFDNGREHFELGSTRGRDAFATTVTSCVAFYKRNDDLYVERNSTNSDGTTSRWVEYFDWSSRELLNCSKHQSYGLSGFFPASAAAAGSLPVSESTGLIWECMISPTDGSWVFFSQFQPHDAPALYDTRYTWTPELGPLSSTTTPIEIPGLEGQAKTWHRVYFGGEIGLETPAAFGTSTQVDLDIGGTSVTGNLVQSVAVFDPYAVVSQRESFYGGTNMASRWRRRLFNRNRFRRLIVTQTITAATLFGSTYPDTPNAMYYTIEGLSYDDAATYQKWAQRGKISWG